MSEFVAQQLGGDASAARYGRMGASPKPGPCRFGIFEFDPRRRELRRAGVRIPLQQQPFEILRLLIAHNGDFVSRELIQETLWPHGRIIDFERSINTAIRKLRCALGDSASAPVYIETIPRAGYRLNIPLAPDGAPRSSGRSIAIMPLRDLSGTPDTQWFVDGLTDALFTEMARQTQLRVVSHLTMSRYADSRQSLSEIANELDVRVIVEGSILRSAGRVRVTARLLDARNDCHLWAQSYDRDMQDVLALHAEVASVIVGSASEYLRN